jgi:Skp family chaperone for outer membrane proteins
MQFNIEYTNLKRGLIMKKLVTYIACIGFVGLFSVTALAQNVAVIDTQAAILQTQVAQDAFKALEEESEYASMVEQAQELQADRQSLVESLQKDAETLSNEEIAELQKDIQEKTTDLEFVLGKIQAKQNETIQTVAAQLNPAMMQIINDLIVAKKIQLLLGADQALYFDGSVSITEQVTDALDGAANAEPESN